MFIRSAYNYDRREASVACGTVCPLDEDKTQQQFKEEVDINTIVRRFGLTGKVPVGLKMPESGDFTAACSFHEAMNLVIAAQDEFLRVPGELRRRFDDDPGKFMAWLHDSKNREEATKLGFFKADDTPRVQDVRIVNPAEPPAKPAA